VQCRIRCATSSYRLGARGEGAACEEMAGLSDERACAGVLSDPHRGQVREKGVEWCWCLSATPLVRVRNFVGEAVVDASAHARTMLSLPDRCGQVSRPQLLIWRALSSIVCTSLRMQVTTQWVPFAATEHPRLKRH
jgi:hypothetical protein